MRKTLCLLLALLLTYLPVNAQMDLMQRAFDLIRDQLGILSEQLTVEEEHPELDYPLYIFRQVFHPDSDGLITVQFRPDGSLHDLNAPTPNWLKELDEAFQPLRMSAVWKAADLAALKEAWAPRLVDIERMIASQEENTLSFTLKNAKALLKDIRAVEPGAISEEAARQAAEQAILALPNWNAGKLAFYPLNLSVYYVSQELQKPVYLMVFSQKSAGDVDDRAFEQFQKDYLQPLAAAFGVDDPMFAPLFVSVRVDAFTGQVQGTPAVMEMDLGMRWPLEMLD